MQIGFGVSALCKGLSGGGLDGIGNYTRELLAQFEAPDFPGSIRPQLVPFAFGCPVPQSLSNTEGISLGRYSVGAAWSALTGADCPGIGRLAKQVDLIHATDHYVPRCATVPVVATLMDAIPLSHPHWLRGELRSLKNALWRRAARWADKVITISEYSKSELAHWTGIDPARIVVIPLGVSQAWYRQIAQPEFDRVRAKYGLSESFFISVGTLQPRKNIARTIEAHRALPDAVRRQCPLVIIGRAGWRCEDVLQLIEQESGSGAVRWLQHVPDEDLLPILKQATALLFPSLAEGFGLPVVEAFAAQVPVITSNTTSLPEVAGDAALQVDPLDVDGLSDAMLSLLNDHALASALRQRGLARAQQFTWQGCAQATVGVYATILGAQAGNRQRP